MPESASQRLQEAWRRTIASQTASKASPNPKSWCWGGRIRTFEWRIQSASRVSSTSSFPSSANVRGRSVVSGCVDVTVAVRVLRRPIIRRPKGYRVDPSGVATDPGTVIEVLATPSYGDGYGTDGLGQAGLDVGADWCRS